MNIRINSLIIETHYKAIYIRIPFVGAAFIGGGMTAFDSWGELKRLGEVVALR